MPKLKSVLLCFTAVLLTPLFAFAAAPAAAPAGDRVVVLISLDGLAGYYLDDPKAEIPTLRELIAGGARAESMKASVPTVTWPNHTTLVTGVHPARHGVAGNVIFDRRTRKHVVLLGDPVFTKDQIVRVPTIYDVAKKAGLKTAAVRWPATRDTKTLDWVVSDVGSIELLKRSTTPSLLSESVEAGLWAEIDAAEKSQKDGRWIPSDEMCTRVFNLILRRHRPNLALLHLIDVDHIQHQAGPRSPEAYAAIKATDARVREVCETLKKEYPGGKVTLLVVSDHGFSPIKRIVLPNVVLRKAKLLNDGGGDADGVADGDADDDSKPLVRVVVQGGCAMVYILDEAKRDATVKRIKEAFAGLDGVSKVVGPDATPGYGVARPADDPHAPDMLLFAEFGYAFGDTAAGDLPFNEKPERKGTHGHDPNIPELRACFVAWGAGIKPGARLEEVQNTAVTPTIAKLLGLNMPGLDAEPLDAALME